MKNKKYLLLMTSLLIFPIIVNASNSEDSSFLLFAFIWEAFTSIHYSVGIFMPLSKAITKTGNSKVTFWKLFFLRAGILLVLTPIYPMMFIVDFITLFIGAFILGIAHSIKKATSISASTSSRNIVVPVNNQKINCPKCGYLVLDANQYCPKCGTPIHKISETAKMKCEYCQSEINGYVDKCPYCGAENKNRINNPPPTTQKETTPLLSANAGIPFSKNEVNNNVFKSENQLLKELITKEMNNNPENMNQTLPGVERRKSILTLIYAIILDIFAIIYVGYHTSLLVILFFLLVLTIIYLVIVKKYNTVQYIMKEVKQRPDEKISYITASILSSGTSGKTGYRIMRITILLIAIGLPFYFFQTPHLIYEKNGDGYAVRYYTLGLLKQDTKIEIPKKYKGKKVTSIRGDVFKNVFTVEEIVLPDTINEIRGGAFHNCFSLRTINLPVGITEIHGSTFENCYSLESINIPEGVTRIGGSAFRECYNLREVTIPKSVIEIGSSAFRRTDIKEVCISSSAYVNERAFKETYPSISYYENDCQRTENSGGYYGY